MKRIKLLTSLATISILACGSGSDDGAQVGEACGGIAGVTCSSSAFCKFENNSCGEADAAGVCEAKPEVCASIFMPVCGCDGKTYPNECEANSQGVSVASVGEC